MSIDFETQHAQREMRELLREATPAMRQRDTVLQPHIDERDYKLKFLLRDLKQDMSDKEREMLFYEAVDTHQDDKELITYITTHCDVLTLKKMAEAYSSVFDVSYAETLLERWKVEQWEDFPATDVGDVLLTYDIEFEEVLEKIIAQNDVMLWAENYFNYRGVWGKELETKQPKTAQILRKWCETYVDARNLNELISSKFGTVLEMCEPHSKKFVQKLLTHSAMSRNPVLLSYALEQNANVPLKLREAVVRSILAHADIASRSISQIVEIPQWFAENEKTPSISATRNTKHEGREDVAMQENYYLTPETITELEKSGPLPPTSATKLLKIGSGILSAKTLKNLSEIAAYKDIFSYCNDSPHVSTDDLIAALPQRIEPAYVAAMNLHRNIDMTRFVARLSFEQLNKLESGEANSLYAIQALLENSPGHYPSRHSQQYRLHLTYLAENHADTLQQLVYNTKIKNVVAWASCEKSIHDSIVTIFADFADKGKLGNMQMLGILNLLNTWQGTLGELVAIITEN